MKLKYIFPLIILISATIISKAQEDDKNLFEIIEKEQSELEDTGNKKISYFDHWTYSKKKHALLFYLAPMFQYGVNKGEHTFQIHQDAGVMYRWYMLDRKKVKINFQGWAEQSALIAGSSTKEFMDDLKIISPHNASDTEDFSFSIESFFFEIFFINNKLDITFGRFDPLFFTTFTNYAGWDKYDYFSKTLSSDPVPDIVSAMGVYSEYHFNKTISIGGLISDDQPKNNYLYIPDFMGTSYNYMAFVRIRKPIKEGYVSDHNLVFYYTEPKDETPEARGIVYTGNQGLSENTILITKASFGTGKINTLNSAYAVGITFLKPFKRAGEQLGVSVVLNERSSNYEFGLDTYYKFYIRRWITLSPNLQVYYGVNDKINFIPGFRAFFAY